MQIARFEREQLQGPALSDLAGRVAHRSCNGDRRFSSRQRDCTAHSSDASRLDGVDSALCSYAAAIGTIRQEGATSERVTERFFALCFALKQIGHNLRKLYRCLAEWASTGPDK